MNEQVQFLDLLEKLPAGAYTCDMKGLITYFNADAVRLWGREPRLNDPRDRFCGSFRLIGSDGSPIDHSDCWMAKVISEGRAYNGEEILIERPDGQRISVLTHANPIRDESGRQVGAVNVLIDISERANSERALLLVKDELATQLDDLRRLQEMSVRLSNSLELQPILEETLRAAAAGEGATMGLLSLTEPDSERLKVGASLGFDREFLDALDKLESAEGACGMAYQARRRIVIEDTETDPTCASIRDLAAKSGFRAVHSTPLITRSGKVVGVLSTHFPNRHRPSLREMQLADLCARQAVDFIENGRLYSQLREADRSKNEFLATLAHELRNPLAPIRNAVQILHMKAAPSPEVQWALEVVDRQMEQMTRLVDDLLDIARITGNKLELRRQPIELAEVLRVAVQTSRPLMDASGQQFTLSLPEIPIHLDGDLTRLAQVVSNLLNNSSKYTERGGRIALSASLEGGEAVIAVKDSGIGIPADMLPRVFEIFTQVHRAPEQFPTGLGIGLTLVKRLVEMHNGTIEARSPGIGQGSEFVIRLPAVIQGPDAIRATAGAGAGTRPATELRVLIVDDNLDAAASLGLLLRLTGHEVRTAHDGAEALRVAEEFRPDVAVLDIGLPKLDGYEVAGLIRRETWGEGMVLIAATGWGQETDRHRSREVGFDHHLVKPVDPAALIQLLASLDTNPLRRRQHQPAGLAG